MVGLVQDELDVGVQNLLPNIACSNAIIFAAYVGFVSLFEAVDFFISVGFFRGDF